MTPKQSRFISHLIETHESEAIKRIFQNQPKNNEKYPDERADYRRMIFAEALEKLSNHEANFLINCLTGEYRRGYSIGKLMKMMHEKGFVPPMPIDDEGVTECYCGALYKGDKCGQCEKYE